MKAESPQGTEAIPSKYDTTCMTIAQVKKAAFRL